MTRRNITFGMWAMIAIVMAAVVIRVAADEPARQQFIYSGVLRSLDLKARTITVAGPTDSQQFVVPTDAAIAVKDKPKGSLGELMIGDRIEVKYTDDDGVHVAHQISILGVKVP